MNIQGFTQSVIAGAVASVLCYQPALHAQESANNAQAEKKGLERIEVTARKTVSYTHLTLPTTYSV